MKTLTTDFSSVAVLDDAAARWQQRRVKSSFDAMRRRWWLVVLLGCVGLGGTALWLTFTKPRYSGTVLVQLDTRNKFSNFENVAGPRERDPDVIRTEVQVLRSNAVVERVVRALDLTNDPEFNPPPGWFAELTGALPEFKALSDWIGPSVGQDVNAGRSNPRDMGAVTDKGNSRFSSIASQDQFSGFNRPAQGGPRTTVLTDNNGVILGSVADAPQVSRQQRAVARDKLELTIRRVKNSVSIEDDKRSYVIEIGFTASTPEKAALLANAFAEQYLAVQIGAKMALTTSANEWAKTQLDAAGEQLGKAEAAIEQFRARHDAIIQAGPGNSVAVSQQLAEVLSTLNGQLATAAQERIAAETRLAAAKEMLKRGDVYAIPDVLASPLIQQLRFEEARVNARLAHSEATLGPQNPDRKALDGELARLQGSIGGKVTQIMSNLESNAADARAREEELSSKVASLRRDVGDASQQQLELSILERRAEGRRTFYAALEQRYAETSALMHGVYPDARIVSRATPQPVPSWPNVPLFLAAGLVLGAAIGAAVAALLDLADKSFRTPTQLEEATGLPCLGILPDLGSRFHRRRGRSLSARSTRIFRESVRTICIAMDAAMGVDNNKKGRVILVTSALPDEGKTVSSVALATALAASGSKTLLIDADLRRPQMRTYLPSMSGAQDLASILAEEDGCPTATAIDNNLYAISGGNADESAQQIFLSPQFGRFMETARAEFDTIVVDSPPVMVVADAAILARFADVVLHVTRWGQTPRSTVLAAVDRMRRANGRSVGVTMLNRVAPAKYEKYNRDGVWSFKYADYYQSATRTPAVKHYTR